jgi:hypothetical protein
MNVCLGSADANYVGKISSDKTITKIRESEWLRIEQQRLQIKADIDAYVNLIQAIKEKINTLLNDKQFFIDSLRDKRFFEVQLEKAQKALRSKTNFDQKQRFRKWDPRNMWNISFPTIGTFRWVRASLQLESTARRYS